MKSKSGFTLVEISLFIALSAVLFMVITIGVQNSIYQQRYNDSVQSFINFLRNIYSEVNNVQNDVNGGTSNQAIYGKLVTFGERENIIGNKNDERAFFVYSVVGDINKELGTGNVLDGLRFLNANVLVADADGNADYAGMVETYNMKWASAVQNKDNTELFKGAILVVRDPMSGIVRTFVKEGSTIEVNELKNDAPIGTVPTIEFSGFSIRQLDFCVNPYNDDSINNRANVRIFENARNSANINVFFDNDDNHCRRD